MGERLYNFINQKTIMKRTISVDWEREGALVVKPCTTIARYKQLKEEPQNKEYKGVFWAFDQKQFDDGCERVKHLLAEGEKIIRFGGGGYGVKKYVDAMFDEYKKARERIAQECDPQEVYCYEYNNHECMYSIGEGDMPAIEYIINTFGEDVARKIERHSAYHSIDTIMAMDTKLRDVELYYIDDNGDAASPNCVWFSKVDGKACFYANGKLHPVMLSNGERYEAPTKAYWGLEGSYHAEKKVVYNFRVE